MKPNKDLDACNHSLVYKSYIGPLTVPVVWGIKESSQFHKNIEKQVGKHYVSTRTFKNQMFSYVFKQKSNTVKLFYYSSSQNKWFSIVFKQTKQYSQAFLISDLPTPMVFIGFLTQKPYSQGFLLFDLPKPMVFVFVQTQKPHSQAFLLFDLPKPVVVICFQTSKNDTLKLFYYSTAHNGHRIPSKHIVQSGFPPKIFTNCNLKRRPQMRSHVRDPSTPGAHSRYGPSPRSRVVAGQAR